MISLLFFGLLSLQDVVRHPVHCRDDVLKYLLLIDLRSKSSRDSAEPSCEHVALLSLLYSLSPLSPPPPDGVLSPPSVGVVSVESASSVGSPSRFQETLLENCC